MDIYLSHITALEAWRIWSAAGSDVTALPSSSKINESALGGRPALDLLHSYPTFKRNLQMPIHTISTETNNKRSTQRLVCHKSRVELPRCSFREVAKGIHLCSPELTFIQLGGEMSLPHLISIGFEMCGHYPSDGRAARSPISSARRLSAYIEKAPATKGLKAARCAAAHVLDGSASPMETAIAMELTLPHRFGGRNLPKPKLNYRLELTADAAVIARRKHLVLDMYWPEYGVAIEYDSKMHHEDKEARIKDSQKRVAAASMDIEVVSITEKQYLNMLEFDEIVNALASKLNYRKRTLPSDFTTRKHELRASLRPLYTR